MKSKLLHIVLFIILGFVIFSFHSCEKEVYDDMGIYKSKIWINGLVPSNDTVKIYLGTTSGLNSGDIAGYKDNATVKLYVNNFDVAVKLKYHPLSGETEKGYYYYPRLSSVKTGDSLYFEAWIEGTDFPKVSAGTIIPPTVKIENIDFKTIPDIDTKVINADIVLDTTGLFDGDKFFELRIQNYMYSGSQEAPDDIARITLLNDLTLDDEMLWNEHLHSILIDYSKVRTLDNHLRVGLRIKNGYIKNRLKFELRSINKAYYDYFKALDNSSVVNSNIKNGVGIFAGYAKSERSITVE